MNAWFASHRPVSHKPPRVGSLFWLDEIQKTLTNTYLHGNCNSLECPKRYVLMVMETHLLAGGRTSGHVEQWMLPTSVPACPPSAARPPAPSPRSEPSELESPPS